MKDIIPVLDKGYVRFRGGLGDDLTPVDAARVSYDKRGEWEYMHTDIDEPPDDKGWRAVTSHAGEWTEWIRMKPRDRKLLFYLATHEHTSPFRHAILQFEVYQPLMVARQHWKYRIGSASLEEDPQIDALEAHNESSRRYVTENEVFYIPTMDMWRSAPDNKKQGSGSPVSVHVGSSHTAQLEEHVREGVRLYQNALADGICAEQARLYLPAYGLYVRFIWTVSLSGMIHYLHQRLEDAAQWEIREYAKAFQTLSYKKFPLSLEAFNLKPE